MPVFLYLCLSISLCQFVCLSLCFGDYTLYLNWPSRVFANRRARGSVPTNPVMNATETEPLKDYQPYDMTGAQQHPAPVVSKSTHLPQLLSGQLSILRLVFFYYMSHMHFLILYSVLIGTKINL